MEKEIPHNTYRDVQTLLFCKIAPTEPDKDKSSEEICDGLYQQIYNAPGLDEADTNSAPATHAFLTFGGYDAICVYPPDLKIDKKNWLHAIYVDKQRIIHMRSDDVMYHQMHLVSQHADTRDIWTVKDEDYPFFLATLVYGVNVDELKKETRQERDSGNKKDDEIPSNPAYVECSRYERMIRLHLRRRFDEKPVDVKYAIYNGITVSDVVILWRAKNLREIMDLITYIEYSGIARKTLTTLGFPIDKDGQVKSCVVNALVADFHKSITVCMHGAIRDVDKFLNLQEILSTPQLPEKSDTAKAIRENLLELARRAYKNGPDADSLFDILTDFQPQNIAALAIRKVIDDARKEPTAEAYLQQLQPYLDQALNHLCCALPRRIWSQSLGKNDFTVSARVSYANLANLLEAYRHQHKNFYEACWEILTDVRKEQPSDRQEWFRAAKFPTNILSKLYGDFQDLYQGKPSDDKLNLKLYSWADALQELLGSHCYVDRHPVLHGPSYLVYTSLKIAHAYFSGQVKDFESLDQRRRLLKRSEDNIINFIQNLDQLTEQISRNDDAMLNNRSNAHTIHFSLPESALEFYHAFLRQIVDYLMCYDRAEGRVPDDFEYDFLLSPKTCNGFQFRPMLRTEHSDHGYRSDMVWPHKQAYVLELPLERIFTPLHIFFPVVHECFHVFGDVLRQRTVRRSRMAGFIASNLLNVAGYGGSEHKDLLVVLSRLIHEMLDTDTKTGDYLTSTWQQLKRNTYRILEAEYQPVLEPQLLLTGSEDILRRWENVRQKIATIDISTSASMEKMAVTDVILNNCFVYFKECYADAMAIATLQLRPDEYLDCARDYFRRFHNQRSYNSPPSSNTPKLSGDVTAQALRNATVLAACCRRERYFKDFSKKDCIEAIKAFSKNKDSTESEEGFQKFSKALHECFEALVNDRRQMPAGSSLHPPASLEYVINYLISSMDLLYQGPSKPPSDCSLKYLSQNFDHIIRQQNMFSREFYDIIYNYHDKIRSETKPKK